MSVWMWGYICLSSVGIIILLSCNRVNENDIEDLYTRVCKLEGLVDYLRNKDRISQLITELNTLMGMKYYSSTGVDNRIRYCKGLDYTSISMEQAEAELNGLKAKELDRHKCNTVESIGYPVTAGSIVTSGRVTVTNRGDTTVYIGGLSNAKSKSINKNNKSNRR